MRSLTFYMILLSEIFSHSRLDKQPKINIPSPDCPVCQQLLYYRRFAVHLNASSRVKLRRAQTAKTEHLLINDLSLGQLN